MKEALIIAIDGPSGVGKGTLAKALAKELKLPYLDTGLLYRAVAKKMLDLGLDREDGQLINIAEQLQETDWQRSDLRTSDVDQASSKIAVLPKIRGALLQAQRRIASHRGAVLDGRDIGTVVFPNAQVKLFITASCRVRAQRRWLQYVVDPNDLGKEEQIRKIEMELAERDELDSTRAVAPLRPAEDAVLINTDHLTAAEVLEKALDIVFKKVGENLRTRKSCKT